MRERAMVRLTHFRPLQPAFDIVLRETVLPSLQDRAAIRWLAAGRQGPVETGPRLIVTVWDPERASAVAAAAEPDAAKVAEFADVAEHPAIASGTADLRSELLPVLLLDQQPEGPPATILRVARGRLLAGELPMEAPRLVGDMFRDSAAGGPLQLLLAGADERRFVMISSWPDWPSVEAATGASIREPLRSKRDIGVEDFSAEHYELL